MISILSKPATVPGNSHSVDRETFQSARRAASSLSGNKVSRSWRPLPLTHADELSFRIDVVKLPADEFGYSQAGSVERHQQGAVLEVAWCVEQHAHFAAAQHTGQTAFVARIEICSLIHLRPSVVS